MRITRRSSRFGMKRSIVVFILLTLLIIVAFSALNKRENGVDNRNAVRNRLQSVAAIHRGFLYSTVDNSDISPNRLQAIRIEVAGITDRIPYKRQILHAAHAIFRTSRRIFQSLFVILTLVGIALSLLSIYRKKQDAKKFLTSTRLSLMNREVQLACRYIEENFANKDLDVESVSAQLVTGTSFLESLFHKELGMSVADFIVHVKINRVKLLLTEQPYTAKNAVAEYSGFADIVKLCNEFRRIVGVTLEDYALLVTRTI